MAKRASGENGGKMLDKGQAINLVCLKYPAPTARGEAGYDALFTGSTAVSPTSTATDRAACRLRDVVSRLETLEAETAETEALLAERRAALEAHLRHEAKAYFGSVRRFAAAVAHKSGDAHAERTVYNALYGRYKDLSATSILTLCVEVLVDARLTQAATAA